jgi:SAM-dependent methyltransferase
MLSRVPDASGTEVLACALGCRVPVVRGIARFVPEDTYAASFGLQWNRYRRTQLDSHTGTTISHDRLSRCLGGPLSEVRGFSVLEAGCGAGRFTEILLSAGARVFAIDLSTAVDANRETCDGRPGYFVCQADILRVPAAPASFDLVLCLGVVQHTPDPEETMAALAAMVKPGGQLVLDHYSYGPAVGALRRLAFSLHPRSLLRSVLIRLPPALAMRAAAGLTRALLPVHKSLWSRSRALSAVRRVVRRISPVFDYYDRHPELDRTRLAEWSYLDTHDGLTDHYKHLRSAEQIERALRQCGLVDVVARYDGNGVEARARRPL